jgi:hypothetical protein
MPGQDDMSSPAGRAAPGRDAHQRLSRRSVLRGAAGVGVAGIAATALAGTTGPAFAAAARSAAPAAGGANGEASQADGADQIVVHVRDAASGEIDLFRGTRAVRLRDRDLAARLVRASR